MAQTKDQYETVRGKTLYGDVLCLNTKKQFLLLRRSSSDDSNAGLWCIPGGHVDKGEAPLKGAVREFYEETNIEPHPSDLTLIERKEDDKAVIYTYFYFLKPEDELVLDAKEHFNCKWVTKEELKKSDLNLVFDLKDRLVQFLCDRALLHYNENIIFHDSKRDGQVIAQPSPMEAHAIIAKAYDQGKVSEEIFLQSLTKAKRGEQKQNKKYYKRVGSPGNYRYFYDRNQYEQYKEQQNHHDKVRKQGQQVLNGERYIERLSQKEEQGRIRGGRAAIEATIHLRGSEVNHSTESQLIDDLMAKQEGKLKEYAERNGMWMDYDSISNNEAIGGGEEAQVFFDVEDKNYIKKVFDYKLFSASPLEFIDNRIALHNHLFEETSYELIGFTDRPGRGFSFVVKQKLIDGENTPVENIEREMIKRGFEAVGGNSYQNENYIIDDLHKRNVFTDKSGKLRFIDTVPSLRDESEGGERQYEEIQVTESISKGKTQYQVGEISQKTGLKKEAPGVWVDPKTGKKKGKEESKKNTKQEKKEEPKDVSSYSDNELKDFAKNTSTDDLEQAARGADEKIRIIANQELSRRKKEESPQKEDPQTLEKVDIDKYSQQFKDYSASSINEKIKEKEKLFESILQQYENEQDREKKDKLEDKGVLVEEQISSLEKKKEDQQDKNRKEYRDRSKEVRNYLEDNRELYTAVKTYTGRGYKAVRSYLSDPDNYDPKKVGSAMDAETARETSDNLSTFISNNKVQEDVTLYRMVKPNDFFDNLQEGDIYKDKSFSSSTIDPDILGHRFGDIEIKILAKKGSSIANADNNIELEYIIDKGSNFQVLKREGNKIVVQLI